VVGEGIIVMLGPLLGGPLQIGGSQATETKLRVLSLVDWWPKLWFQITKISLTSMGVVSRFVIFRLIEDPDFDICPALRLALVQPATGVGLIVGEGVIVGVLVMVGVIVGAGVRVAVGLRVAVGVSDGV
jgi:hypothetical protein